MKYNALQIIQSIHIIMKNLQGNENLKLPKLKIEIIINIVPKFGTNKH